MFKRKLTALNYRNCENFKLTDESFRSLMVWLEDQKICYYKIEDRASLRKTNSSEWTAALAKYLQDLKCPHDIEDKQAIADWLLGHAVRLEYGENVEKYKGITSANIKAETAETIAPQVVQGNPLDSLDFQSAEFKAGVLSLAEALKITPHPDHLITLKAICIFVNSRFAKDFSKISDEAKPFPLKDNILGFDTGDYILNDAAKILRLLYVHDIRDLQTKINETIVAVQNITSNPKTDTKLGKVGK